MKKTFTKLFSAALITGLLFTGVTVKAQATYASDALLTKTTGTELNSPEKPAATTKTVTAADPVDTAWHPQRRLWGYTFGDFYFDQHSPAVTSSQGKENNYYQTPTGRNAFQFRRIYLGYDYDINKKFKAEVLLASEPTSNTPPTSGTSSVLNDDNLADGKMSFYIKNFNLRVRDLWTGTDLVVGELSTPGFALNEPGTNAPTSLSEATWSYRSIERTVTDFHKNNSYDLGAALQGTFDPSTKNFGYVVMVANNTQATLATVYNPNSPLSVTNPNPNTGFYKIFYGDLWAKFFDQHLYVDIYSDYAKTAPTEATVGPQEHNMFKAFAAYTTPIFTFGAEAYTQKIANGVTNTTTAKAEDATVNAISLWFRGTIVKGEWGYFARYDNYNPDTKFTSADTYAVNTNYSGYDPTTKEQFVTAGLDYTPAKNIHFMPNIWLTQYKDQLAPTTAGYVPDNHTLVYRMTFFYTFGK
jgi:hypothetical protein